MQIQKVNRRLIDLKSISKRLIFRVLIALSEGFISLCNAQVRSVEQLNDNWEFSFGKNEMDYHNIADSSWKAVKIPHTWNDRDMQSGNEVHYGTGWYKRDLTVDSASFNNQHFLRFEGVGQYAVLYVNDKYVGEHLGSYSAFAFNITPFLIPDTMNHILVKVNNELTNSYPKDNFLFGIFGGIYRGVSLISTNELHIGLCDYASSGVYVHQEEINNEHASLKIITQIKNETSVKKHILVRNRILTRDFETVVESIADTMIYPGGLVPVTSKLMVKNPHLWNGRKDPYLYRLETSVIEDDEMIDQVTQSIGIRYFSIDEEKGFFLNGEPYRLYGVCRHQEWEDPGNALLPEHHQKDMELITEIGATSIRLAHYQQAGYIYSLADSIGFLIWAEIPFVNGYKEGADGNAMQQLTELIKQNFNHPSIFVWGLHNEVIKNDIVAEPVNLTIKLHNLAKDLDPSRFTVSVSNTWWIIDHPIHELADLQGFNRYTGWYGGRAEETTKLITNYHQSKPAVRVSVSEYGAGGNIAHQTQDLSVPEPPDPTGQFFPESYQTHFHEVTYTAIENAPYIWASYVWNMFDFAVPEWDRGGIKGRNHKGLITYDRKTKKDAFYWYKANWSDEHVLYLTGRRNNELNTGLCHFSAYCNFAIPELFIDGKSYGKMTRVDNSVKYISHDIKLAPGDYRVQIKVTNDKAIIQDEYNLTINKVSEESEMK